MPTAIIFDIDGTLIDSNGYHARAWQEAFSHHGKEIPFDRIRPQIGKGGDQLMPVFLSEREIAEFGDDLKTFRDRYFKENFLPLVRPFPMVRELFQRILADGTRIALASSGSTKEVAEYKKIANVADLIDADTSSDDAERSKPEPDIFLAALDRLGEPADRVLIIGDTPYDAIAAGKAGARTLGVLCGGFPEADLRAAGCLAIYRDPEHLLNEFDRSPLAKGSD